MWDEGKFILPPGIKGKLRTYANELTASRRAGTGRFHLAGTHVRELSILSVLCTKGGDAVCFLKNPCALSQGSIETYFIQPSTPDLRTRQKLVAFLVCETGHLAFKRNVPTVEIVDSEGRQVRLSGGVNIKSVPMPVVPNIATFMPSESHGVCSQQTTLYVTATKGVVNRICARRPVIRGHADRLIIHTDTQMYTVIELDMKGYSGIARAKGSAEAVKGLNQEIEKFVRSACQGIVDPNLVKSRAKSTGDGAIIVFETTAQAYSFARRFYEQVDAFNAKQSDPSERRSFRMGMAREELAFLNVFEKEDFAGSVISDAVRLETDGTPGTLMASANALADLPADVQSEFSSQFTFKDKGGQEHFARFKILSTPLFNEATGDGGSDVPQLPESEWIERAYALFDQISEPNSFVHKLQNVLMQESKPEVSVVGEDRAFHSLISWIISLRPQDVQNRKVLTLLKHLNAELED